MDILENLVVNFFLCAFSLGSGYLDTDWHTSWYFYMWMNDWTLAFMKFDTFVLLFVLKYKKFRVVISYYSNNSCWWFDLTKISWILKTHYRICYEILNDERTHTSSICMNVRVCILNKDDNIHKSEALKR